MVCNSRWRITCVSALYLESCLLILFQRRSRHPSKQSKTSLMKWSKEVGEIHHRHFSLHHFLSLLMSWSSFFSFKCQMCLHITLIVFLGLFIINFLHVILKTAWKCRKNAIKTSPASSYVIRGETQRQVSLVKSILGKLLNFLNHGNRQSLKSLSFDFQRVFSPFVQDVLFSSLYCR